MGVGSDVAQLGGGVGVLVLLLALLLGNFAFGLECVSVSESLQDGRFGVFSYLGARIAGYSTYGTLSKASCLVHVGAQSGRVSVGHDGDRR